MRTRLERLLLYKRYIDFLVNKELEKQIKESKNVQTTKLGKTGSSATTKDAK